MENPYVTIIGHPTGRLINRREPADLDMEAVIAAAARTGTALELNASWQRLDLNDRHVRMARDAGVMLAIDTDSHAPGQLEQIEFGVRTARRGWLRAEDVLNTRPLPTVRKWIARKRSGKPH
jgi:DNA polymerase (family 10)